MFQIYIASSWRNEKAVLLLAEMLRKDGNCIYCFAEQGEGQHIFNWPDVVTPEDDGITALEGDHSKKGYKIDKWFLDWANCCVLLNPCGRDAHLEAGYIKGKGGLLYILGSFPKGEFSNMYHLADGLYRVKELNNLRKELSAMEVRL